MYLPVNRWEIKSPNCSCVSKEKRLGVIGKTTVSVDVDTYEASHHSDLSPGERSNAERIRVDDDGTAVEHKVRSSWIEPGG